MRNITITIDETGAIEMEANGFKGKACEQKMEALIAALGVPVTSRKKPEYFQEDKQHIQEGGL